MPVEAVNAEGFTKQLDTLAGIDAWQIHGKQGIRGIASRVQWDDSRSGFPYRTFTIRKRRFNGSDTEFAKRTLAINAAGGWLYPYLTCHAYLSQPKREGELIAVALARTDDIVKMISSGGCREQSTTNASFWVVDWDQMRRLGFKVSIYTKPPDAAVLSTSMTVTAKPHERAATPTADDIFG